jgi:hypothetical protein
MSPRTVAAHGRRAGLRFGGVRPGPCHAIARVDMDHAGREGLDLGVIGAGIAHDDDKISRGAPSTRPPR